jgi:hypothetical protein
MDVLAMNEIRLSDGGGCGSSLALVRIGEASSERGFHDCCGASNLGWRHAPKGSPVAEAGIQGIVVVKYRWNLLELKRTAED